MVNWFRWATITVIFVIFWGGSNSRPLNLSPSQVKSLTFNFQLIFLIQFSGIAWHRREERAVPALLQEAVRHLQDVRGRHATEDQERRRHEALAPQGRSPTRGNCRRLGKVFQRLKTKHLKTDFFRLFSNFVFNLFKKAHFLLRVSLNKDKKLCTRVIPNFF